MIEVFATRVFENSKENIGQLVVADGDKVLFKCATIELPFVGNMKYVSCIYTGVFDCEKVVATPNINYPHVSIKDVDNRGGIKIHVCNYVRQLRGCIGVGERHVDIDGDGDLDIVRSKVTFDKLMAILPNKFKITIR